MAVKNWLRASENLSPFSRAGLFCLWVVINVADGFWLYFYVEAIANPNPRTAVNRNSSALGAFEGMMYIFGFFLGVVNFCVWLVLLTIVVLPDRSAARPRGSGVGLPRVLLTFVVIWPLLVFMTIMPFTGGWIVTPIVTSYVWRHRCDDYSMYAILDGASYAKMVPDVIYFFDTASNRFLYTYEITHPGEGSQWYLRLLDWQVTQDSISLDEYPTLQSVGYNLTSNTITGNCTLPSSSTKSGSTTTSSCVTGTFDPGNHLFFNITSTVPLNDTANTASVKPETTILRIADNAWTYNDAQAPPALVLQHADPQTGALGATVLRTASTKAHDCTELKVCISGVPGREGSLIGAEVLGPLGIMLMAQSDYSIQCTTPSQPS